ncbi:MULTISPECIES: hypothetical protein [Halorussus]|uniref:hypothetical protein n=1 Tax=Halorussus TaxID=1070314 RepID=UPI000E217A52|nr:MULTISPECIES: hypothetical protein [Halorussus]NHN57961.1 hypothetical protein [Halorussus sp. JP-T4]
MSSLSEWDALAGAAAVAYLVALLRLRVDVGNPVHLVPFAVVLFAGLVLVLQGLAPPDLEVRLVRFRLGRVGRAVEWTAGVALTGLTWLALGEPLTAVAVGLAVGYLWTQRDDYYVDLRDRVDRLEAAETAVPEEKS